MSELKALTEPEQLEAELEASYDELSEFVCDHGPELCTRGMPPLRANRAILACLQRLKDQRDTWQRCYESAKQWIPDTESLLRCGICAHTKRAHEPTKCLECMCSGFEKQEE